VLWRGGSTLPIMVESRKGGFAGRAYAALAFWYAVIWCIPAAVAAMLNSSDSGQPGVTYVDGRATDCTGQFGCPTQTNIGSVLTITAVALAPSLLVAVPLCAYLARKWQMPALAGFVAAVTGWLALCLGFLLYLGR
jgi:hypothetical protein